jgi:predicted transposase YdaD
MRDPFDIHQPHDALFRATFSRVEHAAPVLRAIVPSHLASSIDWSALRLLPGSFIDEALRKSQSDLLFEATPR